MGQLLLVIGAGGHARSCIDVIELDAQFVIGGLIGHTHEVGSYVSGYPVIGTDTDLSRLRTRHSCALIGIGHIKTALPREKLFDKLHSLGFRMPVVVSPHAYVSRRASIEAGTIVMHGAVVNAGARIGRNCIINSQALVEHDTEIGDHVHIAPGARLNGAVSVGKGTFIGSGSIVKQGVMIGERCIIPMGTAVRRTYPDGSSEPSDGR